MRTFLKTFPSFYSPNAEGLLAKIEENTSESDNVPFPILIFYSRRIHFGFSKKWYRFFGGIEFRFSSSLTYGASEIFEF